MIKRTLEKTIQIHAETYPVIAVTGPRQSGKSTLVKSMFPHKPYFSLEDPDIRRFAEDDPKGFLAQMPRGGIIDEVQHVPMLLSYMQSIIDAKPMPGAFVISGSNHFLLAKHVSQSLAGRVSIQKLLPFTISELTNGGYAPATLEEYLIKGSYPRVQVERFAPADWYLNYIETYLEKDLKDFLKVADLSLFRRFITILATQCGQLLNLASIGNLLGISHNTVKSWVFALEQSFIVFTHQPYFANLQKRIIKTPKIYFYDTGLVSALVRIKDPLLLVNHIMKGQLFENMVIAEFRKESLHRNLHHEFYFYRDHSGKEIDLVFNRDSDMQTIEIKSGQTVGSDWLKHLRWFEAAHKNLQPKMRLVYGGDSEYVYNDVLVSNWRKIGGFV